LVLAFAEVLANFDYLIKKDDPIDQLITRFVL